MQMYAPSASPARLPDDDGHFVGDAQLPSERADPARPIRGDAAGDDQAHAAGARSAK